MAWTTPKTNWNDSDYYNHADLTRVETNTEYIYDHFVSLGYAITALAQILSRTNATIDYYDSLNRIENNILSLKNASFEPVGWLTPKVDWVSVLDAFSYVDANRLENNLLSLKNMMDNIIASLLYCGDSQASICGKGNTLF